MSTNSGPLSKFEIVSAVLLALLIASCSKMPTGLISNDGTITEGGEQNDNPGGSQKNGNGGSLSCPNSTTESLQPGEKRVHICHKYLNNSRAPINLVVGESSVEHHIKNHGDNRGCCK